MVYRFTYEDGEQRLDIIETISYRLTHPITWSDGGFLIVGPGGMEVGPFTIEELIEKGIAVWISG